MNPQILIFEWLCGGGLWLDQVKPSDASDLLLQGASMLNCVGQEFLDADFRLSTTWDARLDRSLVSGSIVDSATEVNRHSNLPLLLDSLASEADFVLTIAPETDGRLLRTLSWLETHQTKLLNASVEFCDLAGNKNSLQQYLHDSGISVPAGVPGHLLAANQARLKAIEQERVLPGGPWVLKPVDGCGGVGIRLIENGHRRNAILELARRPENSELTDVDWSNYRIEEFVSGIPVSVSAIVGNCATKLFGPLRQTFSDDPLGTFSNCIDDLPAEISQRATALAESTVAALKDFHPLGFIGIDCVIGESDVVVEINPRITMSFSLLRSTADNRIAREMISAFRNRD